nr:hypothetical protein [Candidatus Njordarchaeota archaeon]
MDHVTNHNCLTCPVCHEKADQEFRDGSLCPSHKAALDKIREHYREWISAYSSLTKEEYLQLLIKNPNSGEWVAEVARYLLKMGGAERL